MQQFTALVPLLHSHPTNLSFHPRICSFISVLRIFFCSKLCISLNKYTTQERKKETNEFELMREFVLRVQEALLSDHPPPHILPLSQYFVRIHISEVTSMETSRWRMRPFTLLSSMSVAFVFRSLKGLIKTFPVWIFVVCNYDKQHPPEVS